MHLSFAIILPLLAAMGVEAVKQPNFHVFVDSYSDKKCKTALGDGQELPRQAKCAVLPEGAQSYLFRANKGSVRRGCRIQFFENDNCTGHFSNETPVSTQGQVCYSNSTLGFVPRAAARYCGVG